MCCSVSRNWVNGDKEHLPHGQGKHGMDIIIKTSRQSWVTDIIADTAGWTILSHTICCGSTPKYKFKRKCYEVYIRQNMHCLSSSKKISVYTFLRMRHSSTFLLFHLHPYHLALPHLSSIKLSYYKRLTWWNHCTIDTMH